jgi:hypothetical protein
MSTPCHGWGFQTQILVVGTDCIGSYKSYDHEHEGPLIKWI